MSKHHDPIGRTSLLQNYIYTKCLEYFSWQIVCTSIYLSLYLIAGRLDVGNDELVGKLKAQLRETHQELEETRVSLDKQTKARDDFQEQVLCHFQKTL